MSRTVQDRALRGAHVQIPAQCALYVRVEISVSDGKGEEVAIFDKLLNEMSV